ncbi:MerR family transcriptional regulator [Actinomadura sp. CNU-125]|uniref:MerR family transcriptional regulator n=1 Tax=Actinomadura sp. CNU-125 TaxID=1904961 RepID=UPI0021CCA7D9|nr:MerR family transcriptional regulator [Actinomadura sp. CNU-125]
MTDATSIAIGDLSALTGVPVRTIRFYCDEGILEPVRSTGGHRRFDAAAADRLRLVRRLRGLGLGLPAITAVLTGERSLDEAVAAERSALDVELAALAWRRASLRAVEDADPAERAARLDLLAAVQDGPKAHEALLDFWRRRIMVPVPDEIVRVHLELTVPAPPDDPRPARSSRTRRWSRWRGTGRSSGSCGRRAGRTPSGSWTSRRCSTGCARPSSWPCRSCARAGNRSRDRPSNGSWRRTRPDGANATRPGSAVPSCPPSRWSRTRGCAGTGR